ncbi:MAG: hypothetical protein AB7R89_16200 [Dehalococcoidia bacterium]
MFEAVIVGEGTIAAYRALGHADREAVDRLIRIIEMAPEIDELHKAPVPTPIGMMTAYDSGTWRIMYKLVDNATVEIWGISRIRDEPPLPPHLRL